MEKFRTKNISSMWCDDQPQNISRSVFHVTHRFALKFIEGCMIYIQTHKTYSIVFEKESYKYSKYIFWSVNVRTGTQSANRRAVLSFITFSLF